MKQPVRLKVNGIDRELLVEPWTSLAEALREELELTGVKVGCNQGNCGSCTVLLDGKAVKSCLLMAFQAEGKEVLTIEGLRGADGELHPLQKSFINHFAIQCGYCTPGMVLAAKALLDENPAADQEEIRRAMNGNLCRCTGYVKIVEAVLAARDELVDGGR